MTPPPVPPVCTRCRRREALHSSLLCRACSLELQAKPKATTYDRKPPEPELDFWRIAQDLLYPDLSYRALTQEQRVRICRVARVLANIPYEEAEPELDDEAKSLLTAHLLVGRVGELEASEADEDDDPDDEE